jgi:hypothetical protein
MEHLQTRLALHILVPGQQVVMAVRLPREYLIADAASARYALSMRARTRFVLESPSLDREKAGRIGGELSRLAQDCGCELGARFLMTSILLCAAGSLVMFSVLRPHPLRWLALAALACFLSAGIGKAIGILKAKRELHARLFSLCDQFERQEAMIYGMHR